MRYLFSDWKRIASRIKKSDTLFLFFDYDGTITPIVSTPKEAKIPPKVKTLIKRLNNIPKFTIGIISGRSLKDIKKMVGLKGIIYAGNHGLEIEGTGIRFHGPFRINSLKPIMKMIAVSLQKALKDIRGVYVEDKGITLSVHFRLARFRDKFSVKHRFYTLLRPYLSSKKIRVTSGKEVLEVRPNMAWDKGKTIRWLLDKKKKALAFYLGDDITDKDGFRAVKGKGISIFVGGPKRNSGADYFLKSPKDVEKFIERVIKI